jgi:hypothetical protein
MVFQWKIQVFLWPLGLHYIHLVFLLPLWCIICSFGTFSPYWYVVPRKIWQPRCVHTYGGKIKAKNIFAKMRLVERVRVNTVLFFALRFNGKNRRGPIY